MRFLPAALLTSLLCVHAHAQAPADYASDPAFKKLSAEARSQTNGSRDVTFAEGTWRKANKIAGGKCMECFDGMVSANIRLGEYKRAIQAAREMDAAADLPKDHALAQVYIGRVSILANDGKKPNAQMLADAHEALLKAEPLLYPAYYFDGRVLSLLKRDSEASEAFAAYKAHAPKNDPLVARASRFAARPELARQPMTPPVIVNTLAGKEFNLDNMSGRVVLIDFWATWCGPCMNELPHIKKLAAQYANEPFELISVSWDADEKKWKDFVAANGMTWNQFRDTDHRLTNAFGINAIPHYFTIDANGVLTAENMGSGSNIDSRIRKLLDEAKKSPTQTASNTTQSLEK